MKRSLTSLQRRVVVTGIGGITPLGETFHESWSNLIYNTPSTIGNINAGITNLEEALHVQNLPEAQHDAEWKLMQTLPCQVAAPVRGLEYDTRTSRFVQMALVAGKEAIGQAHLGAHLGLSKDDTESPSPTVLRNRTRTGISIGSAISSLRETLLAAAQPHRRLSPHTIPKILSNSPSARTSLEFHLEGPNLTHGTACAAASHAIGDAMRSILWDDADIMLAGGSDASLDPLCLASFCKLRALSSNFNDTPELASRPFDKNRDGFVMGEGSVILVLEELEHAKQRGAKILCELSGYGSSGDAHHITSPDPKGKGAERSIRMAMDRAGLLPHDVDYVNAHATSTPMGDDIEASTIQRVFGSSLEKRERDVFMSSTKGATGHLLGASGAIEAAISVMSIVEGKIPATWNLHDKGGNLREDKIQVNHVTETLDQQVNTALSNSFGFGGTNASLIFTAFYD